MNKIRVFTPEEIQEICFLYQNQKETITAIARKYDTYPQRVRDILIKSNIKIIRHPRYVNKFLKEDYFETIDSEEKAYFLGLIYTDGCVRKPSNRNSYELRLELKIEDKYMIEKLKEELNSGSKIIISKRTNRSGSITESALLSIMSKKLVEDLEKYGIIENKTYKSEHLPQVDEKFLAPFVRGLIDGDGAIYTTKNYNKQYDKYYDRQFIYFCSYHKSCCEDFFDLVNKLLPNELKVDKMVGREKTGTYRATLSSKKVTSTLAKILYENSNIHLKRKYEIAKEFYTNT